MGSGLACSVYLVFARFGVWRRAQFRPPSRIPECPRLARGIVTFFATQQRRPHAAPQCPRLARGIVTFFATQRRRHAAPECPRLAPGDRYVLRYTTTTPPPRARMPPTCSGDRYVLRYTTTSPPTPPIPRLARGIVTFFAKYWGGKAGSEEREPPPSKSGASGSLQVGTKMASKQVVLTTSN